jgi:MinD-like ATPase involved in chromosome partitioning or flagellar assembly
MALICVTSAHGAPGATTLALLVAGCWPRPTAVVEADPSGGVLAVRYGLGRTPGLADLAAAVDTHASVSALWSSAQSLPGGLPVVAAPESGGITVGILDDVAGPLARWLRGLDDVDVFVDCGRSIPGSPTTALMAAADPVLVVARPIAHQLYPTAHRVHALATEAGARTVGVVLVGDGPHGASEVAAQLKVDVLGVVADDPRTAGAFAGGGAGRASRRAPLVRSVNVLVESLAGRLGVMAEATDAAHMEAPRTRRANRASTVSTPVGGGG